MMLGRVWEPCPPPQAPFLGGLGVSPGPSLFHRPSGSFPVVAKAAHLSRARVTAAPLMSAPTNEQPAASDASAELPLPANGSHTTIPGSTLPINIREKSSTGFWAGHGPRLIRQTSLRSRRERRRLPLLANTTNSWRRRK